MKPQPQHHADQLEEMLSSLEQNVPEHSRSIVSDGVDPEVRELVLLAQQFRASPSLMPDPAFAQRLERKVVAHTVRHAQAQRTQPKWGWLIGWNRIPRAQIVLGALIVCILASTGTLFAMAATVSNPDNPLYGIKVWEQHVQLSLAGSPQSQADVSLQIIHDRLNVIPGLTGTAHADAYRQALDDIKAQIDIVTGVINTLPASSDRQDVENKLAAAKSTTRHTLYGVLLHLPLTERLTTTTFLSQLGAPVPDIQNVSVVITTQPTNQATITVTGTNLNSATQLMVNNRAVVSDCVVQSNACVFTIPWHGTKSPDTITVFNPDGTTAQATNILLVSVDGNTNGGTNGTSNGTGNNGKNGNGNDPSNPNGNSDGNEGHQHGGGTPVGKPDPAATPVGKPAGTPVPHK